MAEEVFEYINERLFTEEKPVLFTDLICRFKVGPSRAKYLMYSYYKQNTSTKFNCIIICVDKDRNIKVVNDLDTFDDQQTLADCFIYAFNTTDILTPVSVARDLQDVLPIRNCFELKFVSKRAKTLDTATTKPSPVPVARSRTVPEAKETAKKPPAKSKDTGLRSTAILAKMRGERERKERERREELERRRQEQVERETKKDKKRSAQMEELSNLFDEDEDMTDENEREMTEEPATETSDREESTPMDKQELEELLETTADDSLMQTKNEEDTPGTRPDADSSYVDEDGYTVTNRAATSTPPQKVPQKRPSTAIKPDIPSKRSATKGKRTQGTLENFFKKR